TPPAGFTPPAQTGGLPIADPLSNLPLPHQLNPPYTPPGVPVFGDVNLTSGAATPPPGIYRSIRVGGFGTNLPLNPCPVRNPEEMRVSQSAIVTVGSATLYFACSSYPDPCASGSTGAGLRIPNNASFVPQGMNDLAPPY